MTTMPAPTSRFARFLRPGAIMMAFGSVLILAGVVQTTTSHFNNDLSCPSGTTLIAKFDYGFHGYDFDSPSGNEHVVTLSHADSDGAWFASSKAVSAIVVKGGTSSVVYSISPPQVTGSFSNSGLPEDSHHNKPDITNVQFCGSSSQVTTTTNQATTTTHGSTTTSSTTTSTTSPSTSTTCQCNTTTTNTQPHETTTTTCHQCESTTTQHSSSTTCGCSTTTVHVVPTTCHCSTTTTQPQETTTTVGETTTSGATTTTVGATTTSNSEVSGSTIHITTTTHRRVSGQGTSTSFGPTVSSTSLYTGNSGSTLPFTGSSSTPLIVIGLVLLATGLTLTLSQARRRERTTS